MILNPIKGGGGVKLPVLSNPGSAADLRSGKQLIDQNGKPLTGMMPDATLQNPTISVNSSGLITSRAFPNQAGYISDDSKQATLQLTNAHDADFTAANIKKGVNIFGVTGTYEGAGGVLYTKFPNSAFYAGRDYFEIDLSEAYDSVPSGWKAAYICVAYMVGRDMGMGLALYDDDHSYAVGLSDPYNGVAGLGSDTGMVSFSWSQSGNIITGEFTEDAPIDEFYQMGSPWSFFAY